MSSSLHLRGSEKDVKSEKGERRRVDRLREAHDVTALKGHRRASLVAPREEKYRRSYRKSRHESDMKWKETRSVPRGRPG